MGRRPSGALPAMRQHKATNTARIVVAGKVHSLGRWGSPEAQDRYDTLMAAFIASGRTSLDAGRAVIGRPGAAAPATEPPPSRPAKDATGGLTVGELARAWLADIQATRPDCRRTSLWHGAIAASRAVRPFATMPVAAFGSRALVEVQRGLVNRPATVGKAGDDNTPAKRLSRRYINDIVGRVRQLFHWGVLHELVPDDRVKALEIVPPLAKGQTAARDNPERKPVKPSVARATLPYLTAEVADLIWFIRLTGCRPSEARRMKLCRIRDRHKAVWRYVPKRHKTSHRGKQRHVPIGPEAQAIVLKRIARSMALPHRSSGR